MTWLSEVLVGRNRIYKSLPRAHFRISSFHFNAAISLSICFASSITMSISPDPFPISNPFASSNTMSTSPDPFSVPNPFASEFQHRAPPPTTKASIPAPTPVPVKSVADILSRLADCKDDAQRLRDSTPSIDYYAMDQLKKQTGQGRGWVSFSSTPPRGKCSGDTYLLVQDVFVIWYPRLLRNLRDIADGLRGSSSVAVQDNERVAIGEKWDNVSAYYFSAPPLSIGVVASSLTICL